MQCETYINNNFAPKVIIMTAQEKNWTVSLSKNIDNIEFCNDIRRLNNTLSENNYSICIADLTKDNFSLQSFTKEALRVPHVKWIAIINQDQLGLDVICHFLDSFCIDYFISPIDNEKLFLELINHQLMMLKIKYDLYDPREEEDNDEIIGDTKIVKGLKDILRRVIPTDINVFLTGESGSGKLYLAKIIYNHSKRKGLPLYHFNCRDIKGDAFEFLKRNLKSKDLSQVNGTLLLENIEELSSDEQITLLSYIKSSLWDEGSLVSYDLRLIATSTSDLESEVKNGTFNNELYNCFNVFKINVPPLRERGNDIVKLADSLLSKYSREYGGMRQTLSDDAKSLILRYNWPGNISQLISQMKRATLLADGKEILKSHLHLPQEVMSSQNLRILRNEAEKNILRSVLDIHNGQVLSAAKELGISRATMYRLLEKHDIQLKNKVSEYNVN